MYLKKNTDKKHLNIRIAVKMYRLLPDTKVEVKLKIDCSINLFQYSRLPITTVSHNIYLFFILLILHFTNVCFSWY